MGKPKRRPISPWLAIDNDPPHDEIVLGCSGIGRTYHIYEMVLKNGRWCSPDGSRVYEPDAWMHRPTPPVWTKTKREIERILNVKPGAIESRAGNRALLARKIFCWLAYVRHGHTICDIARAVHKHHTTVIHHIEHVERHYDEYHPFIERVERELGTHAKLLT